MQHAPARRRRCAAYALAALPLTMASAAAAQSPILLELQNAASANRMIVDSAGGLVVTGTHASGSIPASGAGTRMMWYPGKGAFRAGYASTTQWDDANVGDYSFATGSLTRASGMNSSAMGFSTTASAEASTAMGFNSTASGLNSTAMGRFSSASGVVSTTMGLNTTASGDYSTAMGLGTRASGIQSTAMGSHASTNGLQGAFVYGDASTTTVMNATAGNQFSVRAAGGVRLFTNATLTSGVFLLTGGSAWNTVSDRARKEHFVAVDGEDVLARIRTLPITTWRYLAEEDRTVRHIGPMAQDWHRAFGFSADSLHINSGDLDGVSLAGVQALDRRDQRQQAEIEALRRENEVLRTEIAGTDERLRHVEQAIRGRGAQQR